MCARPQKRRAIAPGSDATFRGPAGSRGWAVKHYQMSRSTKASRGSVYLRCGCRDRSGRQLGARCERLGQPGHGTWSFEVRVAVPNGRARVRRAGSATKIDAETALADYRQRDAAGAVAGTWTTGRWLEVWLQQHRRTRPTTTRSYESHLRLYLLPTLGRIPLDELTPDHVQLMIDGIVYEHASVGRPIAAMTLVRIRATLRSALSQAMRRGLIGSNPATLVELPPHVRPHPVIWTPSRVTAREATGERPAIGVWTAEQLNTFLTFTASQPQHLLWRVIALCGLRRGEACGLRWVDVDLPTAQFTILQQLTEVGGRVLASAPKTAASRRTMAIDDLTLKAFHRHQQQTAVSSDGYVFTDPQGQPLRPGTVTHIFRRQLAASGLPPIRLHDLRHGAATLALAAGVDLKTVQDMLGHSSIVTTADIYTSVLPQLQRDAAQSIANLVLKAAPAPT